METFPILYTERLKLRKLSVDDFPALIQLADNKKISDNIVNIPYPFREPNAVFRMGYVVQGFKKKSRFTFAIAIKSDDAFLGEISLILEPNKPEAQLGYWIGEPHWGQGLMTEAVAGVLKFGFSSLELNKIFASCYVDNVASYQVLKKNGMEQGNGTGRLLHFWKTGDGF